ncbi:MAG: ATPase P [Chloroflexota bacterium]|jgi:P-type E1-E2 ATPase
MIEITVPGRGELRLNHLVCDVNGTLALDGKLIDGVVRAMNVLADRLNLHLITADTHGQQDQIDRLLNLTAHRLTSSDQAKQKADYVRSLGCAQVIAIGQGANDSAMLAEAALGICIVSREGTATSALLSADLVVPDIISALELLEKPLRLIATLRQ